MEELRTVETALRERGYKDVIKNEQILLEIVKICSKYNITVEKLLLKHELLLMNNLLPGTLNLEVLDKLDAQFQQETTRNNRKENEFRVANFQGFSTVQGQFVSSVDDLFDVSWMNKQPQLKQNFHPDILSVEDSASIQLDSPPFSPVRGTVRKQCRALQRTTESDFVLEGDLDPVTPPAETRNSGEVLDEYIGADYKALVQSDSVRRIEHVDLVCRTKEDFFYICDETENCVQVYEQYVEAMCKALLSKIQNLPKESIKWPASWDYLPILDQKHLVAGYVKRIEKSPKGVEVVVDDTQSHLFQIDISSIHSCSIFPGAVVLFEGTKCQDGSFQAERAYNISQLQVSESKSEEDETKHPIEASTREIQIIVASGPYTISTNLRYDPLKRLLEKVEEMKPDLVILSGPFLDENHRLVENGPTEVRYEDIVSKRVGALLERCFSKITTKCIIVPHLQDVFHHFTFPQRAYDSSIFFPQKKPENIFFVDNPATFRLGHIDISTTSIPVLDDLSALAYIKTRNQTGRIAALCEILVDEKSFYPIFPPVRQRPLDCSNAQQLKLDTNKTRLIILTSSLKPFTQRLKNDILCVNPGRLSKGVNNGSFAFISCCSRKFSSDEKHEERAPFSNCASVKILRN